MRKQGVEQTEQTEQYTHCYWLYIRYITIMYYLRAYIIEYIIGILWAIVIYMIHNDMHIQYLWVYTNNWYYWLTLKEEILCIICITYATNNYKNF